MSKLTQKEFKEILKENGMYFENWGYEGILNIICLQRLQQAREEEQKGSYTLAEHSRQIVNGIWDSMKARGYKMY